MLAQVLPGFWRTGANSSDVRECPVAEACVGSGLGGRNLTYCREGHKGPYCNLCEDGYAPDPFRICQECNVTTKGVLTTAGAFVGGLGALFLLYATRERRERKKK